MASKAKKALKIDSEALKANISDVEITINPEYSVIQDVMAQFFGLREGLENFLKELSHPYRNWEFIVSEARRYCLDYFHALKNHPEGIEAARRFVGIYDLALHRARNDRVKSDVADNFLLFLQKIINDSGEKLSLFMPVLNEAFQKINSYPEDIFFIFLKSFYPVKKMGELLLKKSSSNEVQLLDINLLCTQYVEHTINYWLGEENPQTWFEKEVETIESTDELQNVFQEISHERFSNLKLQLDEIISSDDLSGRDKLGQILLFPGFKEIVGIYRDVPRRLMKAGSHEVKGNHWKLLFLFHIMNTSGLGMIQEDALKEINRTLSWLIIHEKPWDVSRLITKTFSILKTRTARFPETALNCVLNMGQGIYKTEQADLLVFFIESVIELGFQTPNIGGVGNDWQIKANTAHIQNIRTWLSLIELSPRRSTRLLSALTIYLALYGVFIKDTDLFPREISKLLNSNIRAVFNQVKQLARLFPAYFNDIGAEGKLRDISTKIDEITHRKDRLIHFLRKQSHVESSNQIIALMEAVFKFWETKDKSVLEPFIPPSLIEKIDSEGVYIEGLNKIMTYLTTLQLQFPSGLLCLNEDSVSRICQKTQGVSEKEAERFRLAVSLYKLLHQKYNLGLGELNHYLDKLEVEAFPGLNRLKEALAETEVKAKLNRLLDYLKTLKKLILSSQAYEIREDIYKKRHITIDIPSMYGSYHEMKFDALGLTFRIEAMVNVLFEQLVHNIDLSLITKATFYQIHSRLRLFDKALKLDGIHSGEFERHLEFLTQSLYIKGFTLTQYLDIIRGFSQAVKNIIIDYYHNLHDRNLTKILSQSNLDQLKPKYLSNGETADHEKLQHRVSEIFYRDCLTSSLGLQQLDLFLTRIHNTLFQQLERLPKEQLHRLLLFDPKGAITAVDEPESRVSGIIHLGNKGYNLVNLKEVGLPVPPAFIITTEVFRVRDIIDDYKPAQKNFREQLKRQIHALEQKAGKKFGNPSNPLLLSVRSGSAISQPGMMNTFLDVGINETIAEGIARQTGNKWFAWDSYRRFLQCYGMAFGMERDIFDAIIAYFKKKWNIRFKRRFSGEQMREVALGYKGLILDSNIDVEDEPYEQLFLTIKKVFDSWDTDKAKTYRQIMGISEDWGTAVTIQAMVYGNIAKDSGTGVFFTHNPQWSSESLKLWGDFTLGNQGEDVVSGLVRTLPISIHQQNIEMRDTDVTLESHFPEIYRSLVDWSKELINKRGWSSQEIEFTFEGPKSENLYILQSRDMGLRKRKKESKFDLNGDEKPILLGHGIGVSGGAISGRLVFSLEEIEKWRALEPERSLILVRGDTVPDDIREIHAADGLLTAKGGLTSHASVVAHRLGKICVVGCADLVCNEPAKMVYFKETCLNSGDFISIDGHEGSVYQGLLKLKLSVSSFDGTV